MSDKKEYFVNRHGKKSGISGAVDEIAIEGTVKKPVKSSSTTEKELKNRRMPGITLPKLPKKLGLIVVVVVALLFVAAIIVADTARRDLERDTSRMRASVSEVMSRTVSPDTTAAAAVDGLLTQLSADTSCGSGGVIRSVYPPAQSAYELCRAAAEDYQTLRQELTGMQQLAAYLESQQEILAGPVALPPDGSFAEIPTEVDDWTNALQALEALASPDEIGELHNETVARVSAVADAWSELLAANTDQNQAAFTEAETKLSQAYEALRDTGSELDEVVLQTHIRIDAAVEKLTSNQQ